MSTKRVMLIVGYDGTNYNGWAYQPADNVVTIEGILNKAIHAATGEDIKVIGASRTDAGVHAYGNVAVFDTASTIPPDRFSYALNHLLPEDVRIVSSRQVPDEFHPRHVDTRKTYEYRFLNSREEIPTKRLYTYHMNIPMDENRMQEAGVYFLGEHDFTSFCNVNSQAESHVRTIYDVNVTRIGDEVIISITGNGFLYNMVRIIAGTLMQVGIGKKQPDEIPDMIAAQDRTVAGPTVPANGLFLMGYKYPDEALEL